MFSTVSLARRATVGAAVRALTFLGASVVASCSAYPDQPDLNTYGTLMPLCVIFCDASTYVTEGDGAAGAITSTVSETDTNTRSN